MLQSAEEVKMDKVKVALAWADVVRRWFYHGRAYRTQMRYHIERRLDCEKINFVGTNIAMYRSFNRLKIAPLFSEAEWVRVPLPVHYLLGDNLVGAHDELGRLLMWWSSRKTSP